MDTEEKEKEEKVVVVVVVVVVTIDDRDLLVPKEVEVVSLPPCPRTLQVGLQQ